MGHPLSGKICLHISYQYGPPPWKNMAEYKLSTWAMETLPTTSRGESVTACAGREYKVSSLGSIPLFHKRWSGGEFGHANSDQEVTFMVAMFLWQSFSWKTLFCLLQNLSKHIGGTWLVKCNSRCITEPLPNQPNPWSLFSSSQLVFSSMSSQYKDFQIHWAEPQIFWLFPASSDPPAIPQPKTGLKMNPSLLDQFITRDLLRRSAPGDAETLNITSSTSTERQTFVNIFQTFPFLLWLS